MNRKTIVVLIVFLFCSVQTIYAATLIESQESEAGLQKTWIDGTRLRAQSEDGEQYMLIDFSSKSMHIVNPARMQVVDMSKVMSGHRADRQKVETSEYTVSHKGRGPSVAGYQTEHYIVSHNGTQCFESFTSRQAVKEMGLEHFISGMNEMFPRENALDTNGNPCLNAENALDYQEIGLPLRLIEQDGKEIYLITRMEKDTQVPYGGLSVPEGFTVIDYGQMVQQMTEPGH